MSEEEAPVTEYVSYNGLGRRPMIKGVPFMPGMVICTVSLLLGTLVAVAVHPSGWLLLALPVPVLLFIKEVCRTDDRAIEILMLEVKWAVIKFRRGNMRYNGDTLKISPIRYGRRIKDVKRYFEKAIRW